MLCSSFTQPAPMMMLSVCAVTYVCVRSNLSPIEDDDDECSRKEVSGFRKIRAMLGLVLSDTQKERLMEIEESAVEDKAEEVRTQCISFSTHHWRVRSLAYFGSPRGKPQILSLARLLPTDPPRRCPQTLVERFKSSNST